ncbi:MAG: LysM peptidoglycan-binding domain-containing protein [Elusimicrobia bacterium]|nr:LysM peptidoglycan-binding domain-containing protein [Elusimicrobiota bacterium]
MMKDNRIIYGGRKSVPAVLLAAVVISAACLTVNAEFNDLGCGARALGMGSAYVAVANDINSVYYNPSGLARLRKNEITTSYGRLYVGLDDDSNLGWGFFGYGQPLGNLGTVGVGYLNFSLLDSYSENTVMLSYGKWVASRLALGLNLKMLRQKIFQDAYTQLDPVFEYGSKDTVRGFSVDSGFLYNLTRKITFAGACYNINQPDMGFLDESRLNLMFKAGFSYIDESVTTSLDGAMEGDDIKLSAGGEKWFINNCLALRTGLGIGTREYRNFTLGFGLSFGTFQMDYSFLFPIFGIADIYGSHRMSLTFRFGVWPLKFKPEDQMSPEELRIRELEKTAEELEKQHRDDINRLNQKIEYFEKYKDEELQEAIKKEEEKLRQQQQEEEAQRRAQEEARRKAQEAARKKREEEERKAREAEKEKAREKRTGGRTSHKVVQGETLKEIAQKYYGDQNKWKLIYEANTDKIERGRPKPGATLIIPAME